jgi:HD-like signal output (HDOD) protein
MKEKLLEIMETKGDLPVFPDFVLRLQKALRDPNVSVAVIAGIIELDPVLSGKILRISNSAFYSRGAKPITSLPLAISKLGFNILYRIVYALKLINLFTDTSVIDSHKFWRHSLAVAVSTQALSRRVRFSNEEQDVAYLAGLMHDIGIMVFGHLAPEAYIDFLQRARTVEKPLEIQEKEEFGIDHPEIGALFIERWWQMSEDVSMAVRHHHTPFYGPDEERRCEELINIANGICNNQGITNGIECYAEIFRESAWDELGLSLSDAENILSDVQNSLEQAEEIMGWSK